jgi:hypothetical protein
MEAALVVGVVLVGVSDNLEGAGEPADDSKPPNG